MKAKSIKGNSTEEIRKEMEKSISNGFNPNLAITFSSVKQDINAIRELLNKNDIVIFGVTSAGEFIDRDFTSGSIAILLLEINSALFRLYFEEAAGQETQLKARQLAEEALKQFKNPAFIVAGSGLTVDGELIIRGIEDAAGMDTTIYGAMAGDDLQMTSTFVFSNTNSSNEGIIILAFDGDRIDFKGRATCGIK